VVPAPRQPMIEPSHTGGPVSFGYKTAWLAFPSRDTSAVAAALGLREAREVSWSEGVSTAYGTRSMFPTPVFVTPPIDGWVLAQVGVALFEDDGKGALDFAELSRKFGEVQKFASHRVVEYHEWQRWVEGAPVRRYCWVGERGEVIFEAGTRAKAEGNLVTMADVARLQADELDEAEAEDFFSRTPNEDTVMAVAAEWSTDPSKVEERTDLASTGLLGLFDQSS